MTGSAAPDLRVADIYPSPAQDPWFARFLSVPMTYTAPPMPPTLQRSIPVGIYCDRADRQYLGEVLFHDVAVIPPLVHRDLPQSQNDAPLTVILLEAPIVFPTPTGDSDQWHHGLLWTDIPERCSAYEFGAAKPAGEVSLSNVLFEFSLLEHTGWERVVYKETKIRAERGVWLRRSGPALEAAFVSQEIPGGEIELTQFFSLTYDASRCRIMISVAGSGEEPVPIEALPLFAKPIFVALKLLRALSPAFKCEPMPRLTTGSQDPGYEMMVFCARDIARLYRVHPQPPNPDWFVLRDSENPEEPFTHVIKPAGGLSLTTRGPFRDFPLEDLLREAADLARSS